VNRLHSGLNPFNTKEPWRFSATAEQVMTDFLRLRHRLLPYLATMNLRAHAQGEPIVQPMYYDHPDEVAAYDVRNQFMFGSELLVAPITTPADRETGLGRVKAWLPEGTWTDVFTGQTYTGGRSMYLHRDLTSIPVLAKAGAIVPHAAQDELLDGTGLPSVMELRLYPGADGELTLAEDNDDDRWALTRITYDDTSGEVTVHDTSGHPDTLPTDRTYRVEMVRPTATAQERAFALLDRAQIGFDLKGRVFELIRTSEPADAVLALQGLDLSPYLLGALSELLLG
jgi:alpha-glucosidase (family GH31 glycosyl hydrolase)